MKKELPSSSIDSGLAIYIHIPYCLKKCPYCDFNTYQIRQDESSKDRKEKDFKEDQYINALIGEIDFLLTNYKIKQRICHSIFFGGGTPSLLKASSIEKILKKLEANFKISKHSEITLEANPGTIQEALGGEKLSSFRSIGINRISMGVQSLIDEKLKLLGRIHSKKEAILALENIKEAGFENFNIDLIHSTALDSKKSWETELLDAISLNPTHISCYGLTIESGTKFFVETKKGQIKTCSEELASTLYEETNQILSKANFLRYEISNHAQKGKECIHNLHYWRRGEYIGLGAGAHSFLKNLSLKEKSLNDKRWSNIPNPDDYITRNTKNQSPSQKEEYIDEVQKKLEYCYLHLRTVNGIDKNKYKEEFKTSIEEDFQIQLKELEKNALIQNNKNQIKLKETSYLFADSVFEEFA